MRFKTVIFSIIRLPAHIPESFIITDRCGCLDMTVNVSREGEVYHPSYAWNGDVAQ